MTQTGSTSYKQTKFGILPRDEVIKLEVQGTKKGLQILQMMAEKEELLNLDFIKKIHEECFEDILLNDAGKFRSIQVTYSSKEAPLFTRIPEMLHNLCEDIEYALSNLPAPESEDYISNLVQVLAQFQHRFVLIHPFVDYNGRMTRLMTNYILMRLKLPIVEIKVENDVGRKAYISALQKADEGDYRDFENTIAEALTESLQEAER